jgi:hypothetical protein
MAFRGLHYFIRLKLSAGILGSNSRYRSYFTYFAASAATHSSSAASAYINKYSSPNIEDHWF